MRIRRTLIAVALAGPLTLTGCGDGGAEGAEADSPVQEGGEGAEETEDE